MTNKVSRTLRQENKGSTIVMVAVFMVALFGFASLSIDVSHVFQEQRRAQIGVDAASYAAAVLLTNLVQSKPATISEAGSIAAANGVSAAEILASSISQIQVGRWNTNSLAFTPDATPYNAVRVPALREVPLMFGKVVGLGQMTPQVKSVSMVGGANNVPGAIPFGMGQIMLANKDFVTNNIVVFSASQNSGNWGKLDLCGINMSGAGNTQTYIDQGVPCPLSVGESPTPGTGVAGLKTAFDSLIGQTRVMPVMDVFLNGNHGGTIVGFVIVKILNQSGNGQNFTLTVQLIPGLIGNGVGGATGEPFAQGRALVQ